jgi:hypothetical protein
MKVTWEVDEATRVEARYKPFGKEVVLVNGQKAVERHSLSYKIRTSFPLAGRRTAVIWTRPRFFLSPEISLHVDGQLCTPLGKNPYKCPSCRARVRTFDQLCSRCGASLPTAEMREHEKHARGATHVLFVLASMFALAGVFMFYVEHTKAELALYELEDLPADDVLEVDDGIYTVAERREELGFMPWGALLTNGLLAGVMWGLGVWGRRAPLPAILVASATYAMLIVGTVIIEPQSIARGILVKVIVVTLLLKGLQAALALRASRAAPRAS